MCKGGYATVGMLAGMYFYLANNQYRQFHTYLATGFGIIGFRDPHGIRPLILGERKGPKGGMDYMFASESVALDQLEFINHVNVKPGKASPFSA